MHVHRHYSCLTWIICIAHSELLFLEIIISIDKNYLLLQKFNHIVIF